MAIYWSTVNVILPFLFSADLIQLLLAKRDFLSDAQAPTEAEPAPAEPPKVTLQTVTICKNRKGADVWPTFSQICVVFFSIRTRHVRIAAHTDSAHMNMGHDKLESPSSRVSLSKMTAFVW